MPLQSPTPVGAAAALSVFGLLSPLLAAIVIEPEASNPPDQVAELLATAISLTMLLGSGVLDGSPSLFHAQCAVTVPVVLAEPENVPVKGQPPVAPHPPPTAANGRLEFGMLVV